MAPVFYSVDCNGKQHSKNILLQVLILLDLLKKAKCFAFQIGFPALYKERCTCIRHYKSITDVF